MTTEENDLFNASDLICMSPLKCSGDGSFEPQTVSTPKLTTENQTHAFNVSPPKRVRKVFQTIGNYDETEFEHSTSKIGGDASNTQLVQVLKELIENQKKFEKQTTARLEQIETVLKENKAATEEIRQQTPKLTECLVISRQMLKAVRKICGDVNEDEVPILSNIPIDSLAKLDEIEDMMKDAEFERTMFAFIVKHKNVTGTVSEVLKVLLTDELADKFNWDGRCGKLNLKKYKLFGKILFDAFPSVGKKDIEKEIRKAIELAHNRFKHKKAAAKLTRQERHAEMHHMLTPQPLQHSLQEEASQPVLMEPDQYEQLEASQPVERTKQRENPQLIYNMHSSQQQHQLSPSMEPDQYKELEASQPVHRTKQREKPQLISSMHPSQQQHQLSPSMEPDQYKELEASQPVHRTKQREKPQLISSMHPSQQQHQSSSPLEPIQYKELKASQPVQRTKQREKPQLISSMHPSHQHHQSLSSMEPDLYKQLEASQPVQQTKKRKNPHFIYSIHPSQQLQQSQLLQQQTQQ